MYVYRTVRNRKVKTQNLFYSFFITVYFYLSFVSNSLVYISIPKNKEKQKLTERKKTTATLRLPNLVSLKKLKQVSKASL